MKVFVSSLITGMEPFRRATREAITTLRHEPIMAEDLGASPSSPQIACLTGIREADVVVLILGAGYGTAQASGLSATHEEYEEAKGRKYVFAFVQEGIDREPQQDEFVREVQQWEGGLFRSGFRTGEELRQAVIRALYDHAITNLTGPLDHEEMKERALSLLPTERRNSFSQSPVVNIVLVGGPRQRILRPVELERPALAETLIKRALFGEHRLFDLRLGVEHSIRGADLLVEQEGGVHLSLNEEGSITISMPITRGSEMEIIEEVVQEQLAGALDFAAWILDQIDATQRLTHVVVAASINGGEYMAWRTQQETNVRRNTMSLARGNGELAPVHISQTRAAMRLNGAQIVEDLIVPLRRQRR